MFDSTETNGDVAGQKPLDIDEAHPRTRELFEVRKKMLSSIESYWETNYLSHDEYDPRSKKLIGEEMRDEMNIIANIFNPCIERLQLAAQTNPRDPGLPMLQQNMLTLARKRADEIIQPRIAAFEAGLKKRGANTEGFAYTHQEIQAQNEFKNLTKTYPALQPVFEKIQKGLKLDDADMGALIDVVNFKNLNAAEISPTTEIKPQTAVEVVFGYFLAKISPPERVRLVELLLDNKSKASMAPALIEQMFILGLLDEKDAEQLFNKAFANQTINQVQLNEYIGKLAGGYQKAKADLQKNTETWMNVNYKGKPYVNEAAAFVDDLPKNLAKMWCGITAFLNLAPNLRDNDFGFRKFLKNPWAMGSVGGLAFLTKGFGLAKTEEDPKAVASRDRARNEETFKKTYRRFPGDLQKYLKEGGAKGGIPSIYTIGKKLDDDPIYQRLPPEQKPLYFFHELMAFEKINNPGQYNRLQAISEPPAHTEQEAAELVFTASVGMLRLHIMNEKDLTALVP